MSFPAHPARRQEGGQTLLALLLVMVVLLFLGLMYAQVGSAADQKTQTQTAADAAAVAAAHQVRDGAISLATTQFAAQVSFGAMFAGLVPVVATPHATACAAAQQNWGGNPHLGALDCGALSAAVAADSVVVDLSGPAGEIADGPAEVAGQRTSAHARARIVVAGCPVLALPGAKAVADLIMDRVRQQLAAQGPICTTPADTTLLARLDAFPQLAPAAIGPPNPVLVAASGKFRVELVG
ncbi:MAG TPA: pilus assembly protein TadG-related protein [Kineosporiaceae bacterium]|nr:pilus assembly protein TadG-related protein [Kineosporiaceae bacterium]